MRTSIIWSSDSAPKACNGDGGASSTHLRNAFRGLDEVLHNSVGLAEKEAKEEEMAVVRRAKEVARLARVANKAAQKDAAEATAA